MNQKQDKAHQNIQKVGTKTVNIEDSQAIRQFLTSYQRKKTVKGIRVPTAQTNYYHKQLKKTRTLLDIPNLEKIIDSPPDHKIVLVQKDFTIQQIQLFKDQQKNQLNNIETIQKIVTLNFKQLSTQQLFDLFTQGKIPFPNSFQTVGHLAHYNLTAQQIPFKKVIGQITLLKCPNITCVCQKTQKLHNIYRTPTLQMMAGTKQYTVKLKQVGTAFQFDFEKVYWCSRLQQQRDRLLSKMNKGQCLADIFCGCGPLAVRAAKKGIYVIANDLNPYGHEYLVHNCKLNKVEDKMICWNMCARQAMKKIYNQKQAFPQNFQNPDHIYMNLPVDAIQFLDVFTNYADDMKTLKMPLIHVNCFVVADSDQKSRTLLTERIGKTLAGFKQDEIIEMHLIKNVTIIMRMYCVTFRVKPRYENNQNVNNGQQHNEVKHKVDNNNEINNEFQFQNNNGHKKVKPNQNQDIKMVSHVNENNEFDIKK